VLGHHLAPSDVQRVREACGIIAVVGGNTPAVDFVLEGLTVLQVANVFSGLFLSWCGDFPSHARPCICCGVYSCAVCAVREGISERRIQNN
jgi:hypothetical protein